jgi:flagellar hook-associated protein 3 FlgL
MVAITYQSLTDEIRRQQKLSKSIAADQAAISTGIKLLTPSQDPQSWVQVSEIGRAQAQQAAWTANVSYGQTRAAKAESNLDQLNNLMARAQELLISGSTSALDDAGKKAVITELQGLRASVSELLNETDYQGLPVFDDTSSVQVPVSRGISIDVVGTRQQVSEGIDVNGTAMSLDDMLATAISSIETGDDATRQTALVGVKAGIDHINVQQSLQGIRGNRLDAAKDRLTETDLNLSERRSTLESTDLTETLAGLQQKLLSLQAAQAAFARINQQSLFDLLK